MTEALDTPTQAELVDALWARYGSPGKPLGDPDIALALGAASYRPSDRDWGAGLSMRSINMLDLSHFKRGWEQAKAQATAPPASIFPPDVDLDDWNAWRNANMPGGE